MATRLSPILTRSCAALKWKVSPKRSAIENLQDLLNKLETLVGTLRKGTLPVPKQLEEKARLREALNETSQTIPGATLLKKALSEKWAEEKSKSLEKKEEVHLLRELLKLAQNEPKLRTKSHNYEEAWPEVEANYFAKMSLYRIELARRE